MKCASQIISIVVVFAIAGCSTSRMTVKQNRPDIPPDLGVKFRLNAYKELKTQLPSYNSVFLQHEISLSEVEAAILEFYPVLFSRDADAIPLNIQCSGAASPSMKSWWSTLWWAGSFTILPAMPAEYCKYKVSVEVDGYLSFESIGSDILNVYRQESFSIFAPFSLIHTVPDGYVGATVTSTIGLAGPSRDYQKKEKEILVRGVADAVARIIIQTDLNKLRRKLIVEGARNDL